MPHTPGAPDITPAKRAAIVMFFFDRSVGEQPLRGSTEAVAAQFAVSRFTVAAVWRARGDASALVAPRRSRPRGTGRLMSDREVADRVHTVPFTERQTIRALESATSIPRSTLQRYLASKVLRRFISRVKSTLTLEHKKKRLAFALAHVQRPIGARLYRMHHMYDVVHIDEKWFNLYKASTKFYLTQNKQLPYRSSPDKSYIGKVMILAAVASPRFDSQKRRYFDGKTGIWTIVEHTVALRSSANRPAGFSITKSISMTREVYIKMLQDKCSLPSAKNDQSRSIKIQQDNAGPHVPVDHVGIVQAGQLDGWQIWMMCQSPRSPGFNILDLKFFKRIQSLQYKTSSTEIDGLIAAVDAAFYEVIYQTLDKCFITLQKVMEAAIEHGGGNDFQLPRASKKHMWGDMTLTSVALDSAIVDKGMQLFSEL